jgi:hypothetical protein
MKTDDEGGIVIPLTNKQGAIVVLLLVVFVAWRVHAIRAEAPDAVKEPLREALAVEYAGQALPGIEASVAANDLESFSKRFSNLKTTMETIEVSSITARTMAQDGIYIRAKVRVNGGDPPDGKTVRYFLFGRSSLTGWHYQRDATAFEYYTTLF